MSWQGNLTTTTYLDDIKNYFTKRAAMTSLGVYYITGAPVKALDGQVYASVHNNAGCAYIMNLSTGEMVIALFTGASAAYPSPLAIYGNKLYAAWAIEASTSYHAMYIKSYDLGTKTLTNVSSVARTAVSTSYTSNADVCWDDTYFYFIIMQKLPLGGTYFNHVRIVRVDPTTDTASPYTQEIGYADYDPMVPEAYGGIGISGTTLYYNYKRSGASANTKTLDSTNLDANPAYIGYQTVANSMGPLALHYKAFINYQTLVQFAGGVVSKTWNIGHMGLGYLIKQDSLPYYLIQFTPNDSHVRIRALNSDQTVTTLETLVATGLGSYCRVAITDRGVYGKIYPSTYFGGRIRDSFYSQGKDGVIEVNIPWNEVV